MIATRISRSGIAAVLSAAVGFLVVVNVASVRTTRAYLLSTNPAAYVPVPPDTIVRASDLGDPSDRIALRLHQAPRETKPRAYHTERGATVWSFLAGLNGARSLPLVIAEVLFAGFGLFVLWWGRDRASLWLGIGCAALAPRLLALFGDLSPPVMVVAQLAADALTFVAFYALFAMAETVASDTLRDDDPLRGRLRLLGRVVAGALALGACADVSAILDAVAGGPRLPALDRLAIASELIAWVAVFCILPPAVLGAAALRAKDAAAGKRSRVVLVATALGLAGVWWSIGTQLWRSHFSLTYQPHFETAWFTLLLLPLAFIVAIRAYGIVDVRFILQRVLVFTMLTLVVTAIFMVVDKATDTILELTFAHDPGEERAAFAPEQAAIAFTIVLVLDRLHGLLERAAEKLVFRGRDRGIEAMKRFAAELPELTVATGELFERAARVAAASVRASGAALYTWSDGFDLAAKSGSHAWPARLPADDPAGAATDEDYVRLAAVPGSVAGADGLAFPLRVSGRRVGCLVLAERAVAADGEYDSEECEALARLARAFAEAAFVRQCDEAAERARSLIAVLTAKAALVPPAPQLPGGGPV